MLALVDVNIENGGLRNTDIAPIPRIPATAALVRRFRLRFQTRKIGSIASVRSVTMQTPVKTYDAFAMRCGLTQWPGCFLFQKYDTGLHCSNNNRKVKIE